MSQLDLINALLIAVGIGICCLCLLETAASIHIRKDVRLYFMIFFIMILTYVSTHLARQIMEGAEGEGFRIALYAVTFVEIAAAGFMAYMMTILVLAVATPDRKYKWLPHVLFGAFIAHVLLLAISLPFDFLYKFDTLNVYHRGDGYLLTNLVPVMYICLNVRFLIKYRKNIDKMLNAALWFYTVAPLIAIALQGIFYGLQLIIFATVAGAVFMFFVILQIQNKKYEKQRIESSRMESELTLASNIQAHMLPNIYPAFPDRKEFDIYATMDPAREVGGDFYDFFLVDDDHLCFCIADVSGKGVPAALFMMASRILLATNAKLGMSPAQVLANANEAICKNNKEGMFVTVWLGVLEISTGRLTAANAGHEYPVLMRPNGKFEVIKDKHGFVIGGMSGVKYTEYELQLEKGAKLFVYTDGVPEANNSANELFGMERMLEALNGDLAATTVDTLKNVRKAVDKFVDGAEQFDDLTMLALEYKGV